MTQYIADLDTSPQKKLLLAIIRKPKKLAEVAAKANISYSTAQQHMAVMIAKGWVKKVKTMGGKTLYEVTDAICFDERGDKDVSRPEDKSKAQK